MHVETTVDLRCEPAEAMTVLADLERYPEWLDIVHRCETAPAHPADEGPAWFVDLRASIGPLARTKRLRMVRTRHLVDQVVRFDRREIDGREHSDWSLDVAVARRADAEVRVDVVLDYSGGLLDGLVQRLLEREVEEAKPRLVALVAR